MNRPGFRILVVVGCGFALLASTGCTVTSGGDGASLALLLHHDDAEREFAYDAGAEQALTTAAQRGWTVVSIRDDFATVFPEPGR